MCILTGLLGTTLFTTGGGALFSTGAAAPAVAAAGEFAVTVGGALAVAVVVTAARYFTMTGEINLIMRRIFIFIHMYRIFLLILFHHYYCVLVL